jgi:formate dehydrogenase maturation protein FdhE
MLASARPERGRGTPPQRRRPAPIDEHGYKLWDKPAAVWDEMGDELRSWYADTHGVRTKEGFAGIAERTCTLCPTDWHNMPHRMKHCPSQNAGFTSGIQRLGKADAARILSRALARHRDAASITIAEVLSAAVELDAAATELDADRGDSTHYDACAYYCDWCGDDDVADVAFAQFRLTE